MTIYYDPAETIFRALTRYEGTILPLVFNRPLFWLLVFINSSFIFIDHVMVVKYNTRMPPMDWDVVGLPASLLVFFVVFYGNTCYERFYELWGLISELSAHIVRWCALLCETFDDEAANDGTKWRSTRLMLASLQILFATLNGDDTNDPDAGGPGYVETMVGSSASKSGTASRPAPTKGPRYVSPFDGGGCDEHEFEALLKLQLLSPEECEHLIGYRGFKPLLCVKWALAEVRKGLRRTSAGGAPAAEELAEFQSTAYAFQANCTTIVKLLEQPVPLAYYHVLKVQMVVVLILIGYSMVDIFMADGHGDPRRWVFIVVLNAISATVMIGLQEIAVAMSDPFGDDKTDFDTHRVMQDAYNNAVAYLSEGHTPSADGDLRMDGGRLINPLARVLRDSSGRRLPGVPTAPPLRYSTFRVDISGNQWISDNTPTNSPRGNGASPAALRAPPARPADARDGNSPLRPLVPLGAESSSALSSVRHDVSNGMSGSPYGSLHPAASRFSDEVNEIRRQLIRATGTVGVPSPSRAQLAHARGEVSRSPMPMR